MTNPLFTAVGSSSEGDSTEKDEFDIFKIINSGTITEEQVIKASKLPWFNMWARKEMRKSFAKSKIVREYVKDFNSAMKTSYSADRAVSRFDSERELDVFFDNISNVSVDNVLKTKVTLAVLYPKLKIAN